jgi:hypothetical protein
MKEENIMKEAESNKKKSPRESFDFYPTPGWCVERLLETGALSCVSNSSIWFEPAAGDGRIIKAVRSFHADNGLCQPTWLAAEIQPRFHESLSKLVESNNILIDNFLTLDLAERIQVTPDVIIGNPPYSLAFEFVKRSMELAAKQIAFLLRIDFVVSVKKHQWLTENMPDIYVLPNRPSFVRKKTDMANYAWLVWTHKGSDQGYKQSCGKIEILNLTTKDMRAKYKND